MEYLVFYNAARLGEPVEADNAVPLGASAIAEDIFPLVKESGEYLGVIDGNGTTLQLMYDDGEGNYWVEVPCPEKYGSFGAMLEFDQVADLLQSLPTTFPVEGFPGFEFRAW